MNFNTPVSEIIRKKREGLALNSEELTHLVNGFSNGSIPDYQISAWLMASFLCGLNHEETFLLTRLMRNSGKTFEWRKMSSQFKSSVFADKHSTGGVGDKVSLILAPLAVVLGMKVPMMSGRGLSHTGGTVDKLESIPGFNMQPDENLMIRCLDEVGACMTSQTKDICPADRKLYSLRDVTATVESIPLITASIVSKKWAEGIDAIVFDVKCGNAAFMGTLDEARRLGSSLVQAATLAGLKALSCVTRMDEPLGKMIGNALEVEESLWILSNHYPSAEHKRICESLKNLCVDLSAEMALLSGTRTSLSQAREECEKALQDGTALKIFENMAQLQGAVQGWQNKLPKAEKEFFVKSPQSGVVSEINSRVLGVAGLSLGIGRQQVEDKVDPAVGFEMMVAVGDNIAKDQNLIKIHAHATSKVEHLIPQLLSAFTFDSLNDKTLDVSSPLLMERINS